MGGEDQGAEERTDAEPTYDANADAARDPAQEAVPRTRDFANALRVIVRRQSLLAWHHATRTSVPRKEGRLGEDEMHLECLAYVSPVIPRRLGLVDWAAWRRTVRSGRWIWVF